MRFVKTVLKSLLITFVILIVLFALVIGVYPRMLKARADQLVLAPLNLANVADGVYDGSTRILHVAPKLQVTVAAGRITNITFVTLVAGDATGLAARVVRAQSLDVDAISGATISTKTVLKTIDNALQTAPLK
jgi:uncharacterized protein with FMN-binding domain